MIILQILIVLLTIYIVFFVAPAIVVFYSIFFKLTKIDGARIQGYLKPFESKIEDANNKLLLIKLIEVSIQSFDGIELKADYYNINADKTVIMFHGYRGLPSTNCAYQGSILSKNGYNVLMVYMRGHGKSGGKCCSMGYLEQQDVLKWIEFISNDDEIKNIVLYGVSMGSVSIAYASDKIKNEKVKALVLDCGYIGIREQMISDSKKKHVPYPLIMHLIRLIFYINFGGDINQSTINSLNQNKIPTLVIHGTSDKSVNIDNGEAVYKECSGYKESLFVPEAEHTCAMLAGEETAEIALIEFLNQFIK